MTQVSYPFDNQPVSEAQWSQFARFFSGDGVYGDPSTTDLKPFGDSTGLFVQVGAGEATVHGAYFSSSGQVSLPIAPNVSGQARIDRVVLRRSLAADQVVLAVLTGSPGVTPVPPALTQIATGIWEMALGEVTVVSGTLSIGPASVTDERPFLGKSVIPAAHLADVPPGNGQITVVGGIPYYWDGSAWARFRDVDSGWQPLSFSGAGLIWTSVSGFVCQYRQIGNRVYVRGMAKRISASFILDICSLPVAIRPNTNQWIGSWVSGDGGTVAGGGSVVNLLATTDGFLRIALSYYTASVPSTHQIPINGSYFLD